MTNVKDILALFATGIIALFALGFALTVAGPTWTHGAATWMMLPGVLGIGIGLGILGAKAMDR